MHFGPCLIPDGSLQLYLHRVGGELYVRDYAFLRLSLVMCTTLHMHVPPRFPEIFFTFSKPTMDILFPRFSFLFGWLVFGFLATAVQHAGS